MSFLHNTAIFLGNWLENRLCAFDADAGKKPKISQNSSPTEKFNYFWTSIGLPKTHFWNALNLIFLIFILLKGILFIGTIAITSYFFPESELFEATLEDLDVAVIVLLIHLGVFAILIPLLLFIFLSIFNDAETSKSKLSYWIVMAIPCCIFYIGFIADEYVPSLSNFHQFHYGGTLYNPIEWLFAFNFLVFMNPIGSIINGFIVFVGFGFLTCELIRYKHKNPDILPTNTANTTTLDEHLADNDPNN